ncbi:MAG: hypothetical protein KDK75_08225 [Alphaproteobacteria bacterium]|nr:hypothetical protein [Alphaproteobacteria bacterium]
MSSGQSQGQAQVWTVIVNDNFHFMDENERYELGSYQRYQDAEAACREIVDEFLNDRPEQDAASLYDCYCMFGEDPFIIGPDAGRNFSAWDYAKLRCAELRPQEPPPT